MYYEEDGPDFMIMIAMVIIGMIMLTCFGCEEELNLSNEKDDDSTAEEIAKIMTENGGHGIYVGGNAVDSKLDTIKAPIIFEGSISNVTANTDAAPGD